MMNMLSALSCTYHEEHGSDWLFTGSNSPLCFACLIELINDQTVASVKKKFMISEMLSSLARQDTATIHRFLLDDERIAEHYCVSLLGVMSCDDESLQSLAVEALSQTICCLHSTHMTTVSVSYISQKVCELDTLKKSLPLVLLVGRLLKNIPALSKTIPLQYGNLLEILVNGIDRCDAPVQSAIAYVLVQLFTDNGTVTMIPPALIKTIVSLTPSVLHNAGTKELRMNCLGLLKRLLDHDELCETIFSPDSTINVTSVFKKLLLSRDDGLLRGTVQCLLTILLHEQKYNNLDEHTHSPQQRPLAVYSDSLLQCDIAEFLFECLSTTNQQLISDIFNCLQMLLENSNFFTKYHSIYGIQTILRSIDTCLKQKNHNATIPGLTLLGDILGRQPTDIRLLTNTQTYKQCINVLQDCLRHSDICIGSLTMMCLKHFFRRFHQPSPVPYTDLIDLLNRTATLVNNTDPMSSCPQDILTNNPFTTPSHGELHAARTQMFIENVLDAYISAVGLLLECRVDCSAIENVFTAPCYTQPSSSTDPPQPGATSDLNKFTQYILVSVDSTCIPLVLSNIKYLTSTDLFTHFYLLLIKILKLDMDGLLAFCCKITRASFISIALEVKTKFPLSDRTEKLHDAVSEFLSTLVSILASESPTEPVEISTQVFHSITVWPRDCLSLLSADHNPRGVTDSTTDHQIQVKTLIQTLYFAYLNQDRVIGDNELVQVLDIFLQTNISLNSWGDRPLTHLIHLYATCCLTIDHHTDYRSIDSILLAVGSRIGSLCQMFTYPVLIMRWSFYSQSERLATMLGKPLLSQTLSDVRLKSDDILIESLTDLGAMFINSDLATIALTDILSTGEEPILECVHKLLSGINPTTTSTPGITPPMVRGDTGYQKFIEILKHKLPAALNKIFMNQQNITERPCVLMLQVLQMIFYRCEGSNDDDVIQNLSEDHGGEAYLKTLNNVVNLTCSLGFDEGVTRQALIVIDSMLQSDIRFTDTQCVGLLLSKKQFLNLLSKVININTDSSQQSWADRNMEHLATAINITANLTPGAHNSTQIEERIHIDMDMLLSILSDRNTVYLFLTVSVYRLITAILTAGFSSPLLHIYTSADGRLLNGSVSVYYIRQCLYQSLSVLIQGNEIVQQPVVRCLCAMIEYLKTIKISEVEIKAIVIHSPWMKVILNVFIDMYRDSRLPQHVARLIQLLLAEGMDESHLRREISTL